MKYNYTIPAGAAYYPLCKELVEAPHTLIAGATGCGKSTFLNSIIYTQLASAPADLVFIDPKRVELSDYKLLPFCAGYANNAAKALEYMNKVIDDIDKRFEDMERRGLKMYDGCQGYLIIDELADLLMSEYSSKIKRALQKILQIGRAAGWHIIACTQCPNRKTIPAEIVLNFTHRVALHCLSAIESRQIVGVKGAEDLPEHGKGLYMRNGKVTEVNIPMTDERDITNRVTYWLNSDNIEVVKAECAEANEAISYTAASQERVNNTIKCGHVPTISYNPNNIYAPTLEKNKEAAKSATPYKSKKQPSKTDAYIMDSFYYSVKLTIKIFVFFAFIGWLLGY